MSLSDLFYHTQELQKKIAEIAKNITSVEDLIKTLESLYELFDYSDAIYKRSDESYDLLILRLTVLNYNTEEKRFYLWDSGPYSGMDYGSPYGEKSKFYSLTAEEVLQKVQLDLAKHHFYKESNAENNQKLEPVSC